MEEDWKVIFEEESVILGSQTHGTNSKWGKLKKQRNGGSPSPKPMGGISQIKRRCVPRSQSRYISCLDIYLKGQDFTLGNSLLGAASYKTWILARKDGGKSRR